MITFRFLYNKINRHKLDPELDDDEPDSDNIPKTPQNHPGVDDGFFPDIDPRLGDDDDPKRVPPSNVPNGNVPSGRRPSVNNFPYAPEFNVSLINWVTSVC